MSILSIFLKQQITHWSLIGIDGYNDESFAAPTILNARWEDRSEKIMSDNGTEVLSRSRVYLENDIKVGDYLFEGVSVAVDPKAVIGAYRVINFRKVPDLFNVNVERRAFL